MAHHLKSKHDIMIKIQGKKTNKLQQAATNPIWEYLDKDPSDHYKVVCKICGLRLTRFNGTRHVMNVHNIGKTEDQKIIQCSYCQETFRDNYNKKIHEIRLHTKKYDHHCEVCGKGFVERNILERHKEAVHDTPETEKYKKKQIQKEPVERVVCPHCGSTFATKISLRNHIQVVHEDVKFECPHCNYSNGRKSNLDLHIKTKHEGLTFPCPHCSYKATRKHNLKVHIKTTHEGLRFNCPHCEFQVTRKDYLEKHISSAHPALIS